MFSMPVKKPIFIDNCEKQKKSYEKIGSSGFTSLELMIVIAIIAILAALAVPSFGTTLEKQRIINAAEAILADLRWARAEAIKRNKPVEVTFTTGSSWSYTIDTVPALAVADGILPKTVNGSDFPSITLTTASFRSAGGRGSAVAFDPTRGITFNNGTATITSSNFSAEVIVSLLGRARICGSMGGYKTCQ